MKLTGMEVSVEAVVGPWLLEKAVFSGSAFAASGFEAVGAIGHGVASDPRQQLAPQAGKFTRAALATKHQQRPSRPQTSGH